MHMTLVTFAIVAISLTVGLLLINFAHGKFPSDSELLSNGYNMSGKDNINWTDILDNHRIDVDDPEISCIVGCSLINLTKANENFEIQKKGMDKDLEDYMKHLYDNGTTTADLSDKEKMIHSLENTGKFTEDEAKEFMEDLK